MSPDFDEILNEFTISAEECSSKFRLYKTLKMHIISDHFVDFFTRKGKTFLTVSDKHVESIQLSYRNFRERHQYKINDTTSEGHHEKQNSDLLH